MQHGCSVHGECVRSGCREAADSGHSPDVLRFSGAAKVQADGKKASAKAQPKPAPGNAQKPEQPKQAAPPSKERVDADAVQRGVSEVMTAFGNVPRNLAPNASQGSSSIAQQLQQHSKAPALPPASEVRVVPCAFAFCMRLQGEASCC